MSRDDSGSFLPHVRGARDREEESVRHDRPDRCRPARRDRRDEGTADAARTSSSGICGEHGGDPSSIHFFEKVGLDYVSCSPYRVPVARLAAAQAALWRVDKRAGACDAMPRDLPSTSTRTATTTRGRTGSSRHGSTRVTGRSSGWICRRRLRRARSHPAERRLPFPSALGRRRAQRAPVSRRSSRIAGYLYLVLHGIDFKAGEHAASPRATSISSSARTTWSPCTMAIAQHRARCASVCAQHEHILAEGPVALLHRIVDSMVDNYRPEIEELEERIDELEEQAFAGRDATWCAQILQLEARAGVDAPRAHSAARCHRPARAARVSGDLRRDGVPVPRRLRPRRAPADEAMLFRTG